jgi:hypothetical protein
MNFSEILVSDVMTPHTVILVVMLIQGEGYYRFATTAGFFPISYMEGESIDDRVVGYVLQRCVLRQL